MKGCRGEKREFTWNLHKFDKILKKTPEKYIYGRRMLSLDLQFVGKLYDV